MGDSNSLLHLGLISIGLGLIILGAGLGLAKIAVEALSAMSRQPSAHGKLLSSALIFMGMLEAIALFALVTVFIKLAVIVVVTPS